VRKQTYSIDAKSGVFSYHKSIEAKVGYLGANCGGLSREKAEKLGVEPFEGVVVHAVNVKSPAAQAGLLANDVILNLGDEPILSVDRLEYLVEQAKPGDKGVLGIRRGDQSLTVPYCVRRADPHRKRRGDPGEAEKPWTIGTARASKSRRSPQTLRKS
jgi:S1-C subfamily serine protease